MVTTAATAGVATGATIKTLIQIRAGAATSLRVVEWGISFNGDSAAVPGVCELIDTQAIAATGTAYVAADIQPLNDPNAAASAIQIGSTTNSIYTASAEGSITTTRSLDTQFIAPTGQYVKQFPLGREPEMKAGNYLRVRVTFPVTVNAICYIQWEE